MLDDQQVMSAAPGQVGGMTALGVHRVCGDDRPGDIDVVRQHREHGDLVGLGTHLHLAQHRAMSMIKGGQEVIAGLPACGGAA